MNAAKPYTSWMGKGIHVTPAFDDDVYRMAMIRCDQHLGDERLLEVTYTLARGHVSFVFRHKCEVCSCEPWGMCFIVLDNEDVVELLCANDWLMWLDLDADELAEELNQHQQNAHLFRCRRGWPNRP